MTFSTTAKTGLAAGIAVALSGTAVQAAKLEEVIVTAQKREQSLQDVPVAVAAVSGAKIEEMGIGRLDELTAYTPGVSITEGPAGSSLFIRGVGSGLNKGFEQSVGTFIDGLYYGRDRSSRNGMFDMERVEVLKGPQGILFGKNTIAGAISMTTKGPTIEPEGYVKVGYEFELDEKTAEAAYGGMLTDTFGARLAVRHTSMDGWLRNTFNGQDIPEEEDIVARLSTLWEPTASLEMIGKFTYSRLHTNEKPAQLTECSPAMQELVAGVDDCVRDDETTVTAYNLSGGYGFETLRAQSAGWTINWDLGAFTLTSVTGYTGHTDDMYLDSDYTHLPILDAVRDEEHESYSQEFRIASNGGEVFDYIAGVYYQESELDFNANLSLDLNPRGIPVQNSRAKATHQETETQAIFGQVTWYINNALSATIGARYSKDEKEAVADNFCTAFRTLNPIGGETCGLLGPAFLIEESRSDENFSPAITLEWRPVGDHMLYAKYSEGYKSGGFDLQTNSSNLDAFAFAPEEVKSFEIGSKSTVLDGAMTVNAAIFRNEYTNLQVSTFDGNIGFKVGNAGEAISQGAELDINWAVTDSLTTNLAMSYLDATYDKFPTAQCTNDQVQATPPGEPCVNDLSGRSLQYAPDLSAHWNLTWEKMLVENYLLTVSSDVVYSDDFYTANDLDPRFLQDSYVKIDGRVALASLRDGWELALFGRNLTDKETFHFGNDVPLSPGSYFLHNDRPRTMGVQARWNF